jgi:hypothetical protein
MFTVHLRLKTFRTILIYVEHPVQTLAIRICIERRPFLGARSMGKVLSSSREVWRDTQHKTRKLNYSHIKVEK